MTTPGKLIGRYEIIEELGRGGMATVYRAFDPQVHREVAIKLLPRQFTHDSSFRGRFAREAKIVAALDHPAIVPVLDYGEDGDQPYLVMRLMSGGTLTDKLEVGPLPLVEIGRIFNRIAPALDAAHARSAIHRDLKPSNILFDQWGEPYVADFGIVKLTESTVSTVSQYSLGTPAYMSPEQIEGKAELDGRSDVYALGVILFEMFTGQRPYEATTPMGFMLQHVNEPIPDIRARLADLPEESQRIINRAMAKKREDRYLTATALATDVAHMVGVPTPTPPPFSSKPALTPPPKLVTPPPAKPATSVPVDPTQVMAPAKTSANMVAAAVPKVEQPVVSSRKLPVWVLGLGGVGALAFLAVIVVGVALLLNNRDGGNDNNTDNAAANNSTNNSSNEDNTNAGSENGDPDDSSDDEDVIVSTPQPQLPLPEWDMFAPFPLADSGFPLPADRLPILPENVADLTQLALYGRGSIREIAYSPDGQWIAAAAQEGIYLYQASDLSLIEYGEAQDAQFAFHPDGQTLAIAQAGDIVLWDVAANEIRLTLIDNDAYTGFLLTYSPDGQYLAAAYAENVIQLWSADGTFLREFSGGEGRLYGLTFSPDSTQLAAAGQGITILDVESGTVDQTLSEGEAIFDDILYLNDTTLVAAATDVGVYFWDLTEGTITQTLGDAFPTNGQLALSADGLLATGSWETTRLWREGDTDPRYILPNKGGSAVNLAFSPDGTTLIAGSQNHISRWRVDSEPPEPIDFLAAHVGELYDVGFAPDGETLAITTDTGVCYVWETSSGSLRYTLTNNRHNVTGLMYTPDGDLVVGSLASETQLWLGSSGQLRFASENEDIFAYVYDVAVSADNNWIAAARDYGSILILNRQTGEQVQILTGHRDIVRAVTFFPRTDITLLASSGDDGVINLWQLNGDAFELLASYDDATNSINALASDGAYLVAGDNNGIIWRYYLETTADAENVVPETLTVNGGVVSLAVAPGDGQLLAVGTNNGQIEIIHLAEARTVLTLPWGGTVAFSPDGTLLAAASRAGLRVWAVRP
ncbi:MAG: protein kinase [Chloroflexi bacterium]|nr:protein kinase [Chloroflexota bacterium]